MNRRQFVKLQTAAAAFALVARGNEQTTSIPERAGTGFRVGAQLDRFDRNAGFLGGHTNLKVSARDTGGELCIHETIRRGKGGPELHRHHFQDEWFFAIRGDYVVQVGNETFPLKPGDSVFAPRKVPHTFAHIGDSEGHLLFLHQPAGSMEEFFAEARKIMSEPRKDSDKLLDKLWAKHGMELLGPPLKL